MKQHSTSKLVSQVPKDSSNIEATLLHLNVNSALQLDRFPGSGPHTAENGSNPPSNNMKDKRSKLKRRKSGVSVDSNDFGASSRSKGAPARASTFT